MKLALSCLSVFVLALGIVSSVRADIAKPKPTPQKEAKVVLHTSLEIVPDSKTYEARLQIRQSDLQELRAAFDSASGNTSIATAITQSSTRTIIAGMMLFVSLSLGGVWLARSVRSGARLGRGQKTIALVLIAAATIGAAAIITRGNAGPPPGFRWRNLPQSLAKGESTRGGLDVEIVPDTQENTYGMRLIIPLKKQGTAGEE